MLGLEGYTVKKAYFVDSARTTVEIIWQHETEKDEMEVIPATIDKDGRDVKGGDAWNHLMEHITIDELHHMTGGYISDQRIGFEESVIRIATKNGMLNRIKGPEHDHKEAIATIFAPFDPDKQKEILFLLKLELFELEKIKKSKNRPLKAKLRKASTVLEAMKYAIEIVEEVE